MQRANLMTVLQSQLTQLPSNDFAHIEALNATGTPARRTSSAVAHTLRQIEMWRGEGKRKKSHKVCSILFKRRERSRTSPVTTMKSAPRPIVTCTYAPSPGPTMATRKPAPTYGIRIETAKCLLRRRRGSFCAQHEDRRRR